MSPGMQVMIKVKHDNTQRAHKLRPRFKGPYKIVKEFENNVEVIDWSPTRKVQLLHKYHNEARNIPKFERFLISKDMVKPCNDVVFYFDDNLARRFYQEFWDLIRDVAPIRDIERLNRPTHFLDKTPRNRPSSLIIPANLGIKHPPRPTQIPQISTLAPLSSHSPTISSHPTFMSDEDDIIGEQGDIVLGEESGGDGGYPFVQTGSTNDSHPPFPHSQEAEFPPPVLETSPNKIQHRPSETSPAITLPTDSSEEEDPVIPVPSGTSLAQIPTPHSLGIPSGSRVTGTRPRTTGSQRPEVPRSKSGRSKGSSTSTPMGRHYLTGELREVSPYHREKWITTPPAHSMLHDNRSQDLATQRPNTRSFVAAQDLSAQNGSLVSLPQEGNLKAFSIPKTVNSVKSRKKDN